LADERQLTGSLPTESASESNGGKGRARVTQLKLLIGSFLLYKPPESFCLSSGNGHGFAVEYRQNASFSKASPNCCLLQLPLGGENSITSRLDL
jgi:hypothetical protein